MSCPIQPIFDRVIVREDSPEEITRGGIIIPGVAQQKTKTAVVVAIGADVKHVKVNDHVFTTKYAGIELEIDGIAYFSVLEEEIQGVLPPFAMAEAV